MDKKNSYFSGIKSEWKKIVWPGRAELARKTGAVLGISAALGCAIVVMDMTFQNVINLIAGMF